MALKGHFGRHSGPHHPSIFDTAELGQRIPDAVYKEEVPGLRTRLLEAQFDLSKADFPVILLFAGVDKAGKRELSNLLSSWMDPRLLATRAFGPPSEEALARPTQWRFWRALPPKGRMGIMLSAWYSRPLLERVFDGKSEKDFDRELDEIVAFERTLTDDGALLIKCWMHLGREEQKKRLETLEADPLQQWRVTRADWKNWKKYDRFVQAGEHLITRTSSGKALWTVIEGMDANYRSLMVGTLVCDRIERHLAERKRLAEIARSAERLPPTLSISGLLPSRRKEGEEDAEQEEAPEPVTILSTLDMKQRVRKKDYKTRMKELQARVAILHRQARQEGVPIALVFEGWDAAGKGGAIRRLARTLDARDYEVIPIAAPTDEEQAQHYLWRFWRQIPGRGRVTIFDRSWYGRVLVERVEGFAEEGEWRRAYAEINDFERQLTNSGMVVLKFWLHITRAEQARRFEEREGTPHKAWKLTEEDWRNREKWNQYALAVHEMVQLTSTPHAPWALVEGNDKRLARLRVLEAVAEALEASLNSPPRDLLSRLEKGKLGPVLGPDDDDDDDDDGNGDGDDDEGEGEGDLSTGEATSSSSG
jgi:polyphosphate:AMP phosphotransferase